MWTDTTRALHARGGLALPSDLTDAEWALLEPFFPPPSHVGRPRKWPMRRVVEAILYLLRGGLPWRGPPGPGSMLPAHAVCAHTRMRAGVCESARACARGRAHTLSLSLSLSLARTHSCVCACARTHTHVRVRAHTPAVCACAR